jgi:SAM-dependent methyltransferase
MAREFTGRYHMGITDPIYRDKFWKLPGIISGWVEEYFGLRGKWVLDFGCGEGTTALGIALNFQPTKMIGVDINREYEQCLPGAQMNLGISELPSCLEFRQIAAGEVGPWVGAFDLVYSWSVFEHINRSVLMNVTQGIHRLLKKDGLLFVQIAPLYYSAEGGHLAAYGVSPWGHLIDQVDNLKAVVLSDPAKLSATKTTTWSCFEGLNRLTADELISTVSARGFQLLRQYRTHDDEAPPDELLKIYNRDILTTNQVVALFRRTQARGSV